MAWSAKIIQGSTEYELVYDPFTQTDYKLLYGLDMGDDAPDVLYHTPDSGSPVPVRASDRNKLIFLTMHVPQQASWDDVINATVPIDKLVDGDSSQAVRAQTHGDVDKVEVAITPDGATYTTYYEVLHGFVDKSTAYTEAVAILNTMAYRITIALTCKPLGYGDSFTLKNELASSPHMLEDSNSDGLADGWVAAGAPATAFNTTQYLTGFRSQAFQTDTSSTQGIYALATAAQGTTAVAVVWLRQSGDSITVRLQDGSSGIIQSKTIDATDSGAVSDKTMLDSSGARWYRVVVSGTNSAAANFALLILRLNTNATQITNCRIDSVYLQTGTTTAPPAFSSTSALYNRNDPETDTDYINYLDVWGVPGDAPAKIDLNLVTSQLRTHAVYAWSDNQYPVTYMDYWLDAEDSFSSGVAPWSTLSDAARSSSGYLRWTAGTAGDQTGNQISTNGTLYITTRLMRLYAIAKASATANTIAWQGSTVDETENAPAAVNATSNWEWLDLGYLNYKGTLTGGNLVTLLQMGGSSGTADIDAVMLLPAEQVLITPERAINWTYYGGEKRRWEYLYTHPSYSNDVVVSAGYAGNGINYVEPGQKMTRIAFFAYGATGNDQTHTLTDTMTASITITPRTRHLLGTV